MKKLIINLAWITVLLLVLPCGARTEELPRPIGDSGVVGERFITIDFDNVDIRIFIKYIAELTGENFVVDKAVQGTVTIVSPTRISDREAYQVFESVLEVHGYTAVKTGAVTKILPSVKARSQQLQSPESLTGNLSRDRLVTRLVRLGHASPEELKQLLTPLVSQSSLIISHNPSQLLIITETLGNIEKLLGIIEAMDVPSREQEVAVIKLENGSPEALAKVLLPIFNDQLLQTKGPEAVAGLGRVTVVPYERVNSLVVMAASSDLERLKNLVTLLDTQAEEVEGDIHVYYLQNATATELLKVLSNLPEDKEAKEAKGKTAAISDAVRIMADEETNALIITAAREEYEVIEEVIRKLDIPRRMVYLEALIMEVDADKTFDVGVQWAGVGAFAEEAGVLATGFAGEAGYNLLQGITGEDKSLPSGYSLGVVKQGIRIGDVTFPNIAAILRAYKTDSAINVISTPQILTTDNKKAEISVGENVPYITSRNTTASEQDYTQYEYKDVATKLSIVPHISQADTLRLEIETEVVRLKGQNSETPTTYKRTASTTVVLSDQDTVVIGGIIGHDATEDEWKVPLLGDIPILGWLFKTHTSTSTKTNMFIFITPRIVRNPAEIAAVTAVREGQLAVSNEAAAAHLNPPANPQLADRLVTEGYAELQAGELAAAGELFKEALRQDPDNPYALLNQAVLAEKGGNHGEALQLYQQVILSSRAVVAEKASDQDSQGLSVQEIARQAIARLRAEEENR